MAFIDIDDDDDDDDASDHKSLWASGAKRRIAAGKVGKGAWIGGAGIPTAPSQLKRAAKGDKGAKEELAAHVQNVESGPMMQRGKWKKAGARLAVGGTRAGLTATGVANTWVGGSLLGGATLGGGVGGWAAVAGGGAALLAAGPIALLAAGTALSLAGSARQGRATYKTHQHIKMLDSILFLAKQGHFHCEATNDPNHNDIIVKVLPYIIAKKKKKRIRKAARTLPVLGSIETARSALKKIEKWELGTLGKARKWHAHQLAVHHCDTDCHLTKAIIAELFSVDEMVAEQARYCDDVMLGKLLEKKMKSV